MVILPAYNEADNLERLVKALVCLPHNEVEKYTVKHGETVLLRCKVLKFHEC